MKGKLERPRVLRPAAVAASAAVVWACGGQRDTQPGGVQLDAAFMAQSAPSIEFSAITDLSVDSRGQIYAGDQYGQVFVLNEDGTLARRFGRMGAGPGEYQLVSTVHVLDGDSLYVYDSHTLRATVYPPRSDRVAYTTSFPQPGFSFPMDVEPIGSGALIGHFRRINGDVPIAGQPRDDVIRLLGRDGSILHDTVLTVKEPDVVHVSAPTAEGFFHLPFTRQTLVRWGKDGRIYTLWTDSSRVHVHDQDGRPRGSFTAELGTPRLPLAASTIDSLADANAGGIPKRALVEAFRSHAQTWPLVQDMLIDDQSRIWLLPVTHAATVEWLAFDAEGQRLAIVQLPRTVRPRLIRGDRMYAVNRDSLDVETLVVYRLTPSSTRTPEKP